MTPQPAEKPSATPTNGGGLDGRTRGLKHHAHQRTIQAEKATNAAIRDLLKTGASINFTSVARVAGVSTRFLHNHPDLSARIRDLAAQQRGAVQEAHAATATGETAVIAALRRKLHEQETAHATEVKQLRGRIKELEAQVAALYGQLH